MSKKKSPETDLPHLRKYNGYVFYDAGIYEATGLFQVAIFPDTPAKDNAEPVHTIYYDKTADPSDLNKAIERAKEWVNGLKRCRVCSCTEHNCLQCIEKTGQPCAWVEDDLCSACQEKAPEVIIPAAATPTFTDRNFFQNLFDLMDGVDVTIRAFRINGKIKLEVLPKTLVTIKPVEVTGTPEELQEGFFAAIALPVISAKGLKVETEEFFKSIQTVQKENQQKLKNAAKEVPAKTPAKAGSNKKTPSKKETVKNKADKKPVEQTEEPALF